MSLKFSPLSLTDLENVSVSTTSEGLYKISLDLRSVSLV